MTQPWRATRGDTCANCGTQLPPHALACPACGTLLHSDKLKSLAAEATSATTSGDLTSARESWQSALRYLPPDSQQYTTISARIADLDARLNSRGLVDVARSQQTPITPHGDARSAPS